MKTASIFDARFYMLLSNDNLHTSSMNQIFSRQIVGCFSENCFYILFCPLISHYCRCCFGLKVELVLLSYALLRKVYEFTHCSVTAEVVYISKINLRRNSWNLQNLLKIDSWEKMCGILTFWTPRNSFNHSGPQSDERTTISIFITKGM